MLDFFRQKGLTSAIYGVIIVGMILVFVLGFNPSAGKKLGPLNDACAAKVRGNCIEPKAHVAAYRLIFSRGTPGLKQAAASRYVLEGLVERELLVGEAERLGLTVTEDEITDAIFKGDIHVSLPAENPMVERQLGFTNGHALVSTLVPGGYKNKETKNFDMKIYERTVKQLSGRSPSEFRDWQTRELLASKMRDLVKAPIRVADDEAFDRFVEERSTSQVGYIVVRKGWIEKYAVSSDAKDIDAWAKDNGAKIMVPVRHILIKGEKDKPEELAAAKTKAEDLLARIKKGEDFAKLAKEFSDDPGSKEKGGQYAGEQVEGFVPEFKDSVAKLNPGELDQNLVQTDYGYHVIKRDLASKEENETAYKLWKPDDIAKAMAADLTASLKSGTTADAAVAAAIAKFGKYAAAPAKTDKPAKHGSDAGVSDAGATATSDASAPAPEVFTADKDPQRPQVLTSSAFNRGGDPIPAISSEATEAIVKFAFSSKANDVAAEPIKTDDGYLVVTLREHKTSTKEDFEKERDTYELMMLGAKQAEALSYYVRRLREGSKLEIKIDENNLFGVQKGDAGAPREDDDGE